METQNAWKNNKTCCSKKKSLGTSSSSFSTLLNRTKYILCRYVAQNVAFSSIQTSPLGWKFFPSY
jgi:hypothetical protein